MQRIRVAALILLLFCIPSVLAEEITLKDGTKITGTITSVTPSTFVVKTSYGEVELKRDQIVTIAFPQNRGDSTPKGDQPQPVDESLSGTSYRNRSENFTLTIPDGWSLAPEFRGGPEVKAAFKSADQTLFEMITIEPFNGKLSTYEVLAETKFQTQFKDYERISLVDAEIDGRKGMKIVWHAKNPDANNASMKSAVYIIPYDGKMVRATFLTLEPLFEDGLPFFEQSVKTFHFAMGSTTAAR